MNETKPTPPANLTRKVWEHTDSFCVHGLLFSDYCAACDKPDVPPWKRIKQHLTQQEDAKTS
jgi:hypothetical protein